MTAPPHDTASQWGRSIATVCGGSALLVGVLVLAGWMFQLPALKSPLPGLVNMKANTALAFVLAGAALVLVAGVPVSPARARFGQSLAFLVTLIGGLTLGEYLIGWQLGIDELLFTDDPDAIATLIPGRMAPSTAGAFVLLGLALAGIGWEPRRGVRPAEWLALAAGMAGLASLAEYAVGQPLLYRFDEYTRMALHTAVVCVVLSVGVVLARPAQGVVGALRAGRVDSWERAMYAALGLALLTVLAGGAWHYHAQEAMVRREVEADLKAIGRLKVEQIVQWRAERLGDASVLMVSRFFAESVARWLANPQPGDSERILAWLHALQKNYRYHDVLLVDGRGQVRLSASGRPTTFHSATLQSLADGWRTRQPVFTDLHLPPGASVPQLKVIAPLIPGSATTGEPLGAVVLQVEARQFLYPLIQSWPTASRSAETLLVRREGEEAVFLNDLRHGTDKALTLRLPLTRREVPAVWAVLGHEGVFDGVDYRGIKVLSVLQRIPDSPWFMVAKMDEAEALADWRHQSALIVAVIVTLLLALATTARLLIMQHAGCRKLEQSAAALRQREEEIRTLNTGLERRVAERTAELRGSEEQFRATFEHAAVGIAHVGLDGLWLRVNGRLCELLGFAREELLQLTFQDITHAGDLAADLSNVRRVLAGEVAHYRMEKRYWRKDRSLLWANLTVALVRQPAGAPDYFIAVVEDISARKRAEGALRLAHDDLIRANAELAQASRHKDEFLANMSHELRTPLNAILGLSETLLEQHAGPLTPRQIKSLTTISTSGTHLLQLINDILDLSKIEAGKLELNPETLNVAEFCEGCLVFVRTQAMQKRIAVAFEHEAGAARLTADPKRLKQILVNLLTNAVKFTPEGGRIGLAVAAPDDGDGVHFTVWDTGIGIAAEDQPKLFKAFTQLDSGLNRAQEGTGLGLALVAKLADLHGGSVAFESEPGKGSRFTIALPRDTAPTPEPAAATEPDRREYRRVLLIEDDPTAGAILTGYLAQLGLASVLHGRSEDALEVALRERPDVILLDILLPGESGWVVLPRLKEHPGTKDIPVVVVSVIDEPQKSRALGAEAHFTKPVTRAQLAGFFQRPFVTAAARPAAPCIAPAPPTGPAILLAEDNEANIQTIGGYLEDKGYALHYAKNGLLGVQLARELRPALILMDIQMPVMDGLTAIREIRADAALSGIPIVALTALAMPGDRERCLAAGATDYLSKPVKLTGLAALVDSLLPRGGGHGR